jgi:hypothetical protein
VLVAVPVRDAYRALAAVLCAMRTDLADDRMASSNIAGNEWAG